MLHQLARAACGLCGLLVLPMLLIHAQPYEDEALRSFLNTAAVDCPTPCFMGVRPGVTSANEAVALLLEHDWVRSVWTSRPYELEYDAISAINWQWTDEAPAFIRRSEVAAVMGVTQGIVESIRFESTVSLGELFLTLGSPDAIQAGLWSVSDDTGRTLIVSYAESFLSARLLIFECPRFATLREAETTLYITEGIPNRGRTIFDSYRSGPIVRDVYGCSGF